MLEACIILFVSAGIHYQLKIKITNFS